MIKETCCFIGHQYQSLPFGDNENHPDCIRLKAALEKEIMRLIKRHHVRCFISGMDLGMNTWCAEIVLKLKEWYPYIRLECALSCETQSKYWLAKDRLRYEEIIASADKSTLVANRYHQRCNAECSQYMVDNSSYVLAVWNEEQHSETYNILKYAYSKKRNLVILNPLGGKPKHHVIKSLNRV